MTSEPNFLTQIFAATRAAADRELVLEIHGKSKVPTTGAELLALVAHLRGFLRSAEVKPGDRVALLAPNSARWVAAEHWHPEQQGHFLADGTYQLRIPYSNDPELIMDILKYGPDCRVVAPEDLRAKVIGLLKAAAARALEDRQKRQAPSKKGKVTR